MKKRILFFFILSALVLAGYFIVRNQKPQWQLITPPASTWELVYTPGRIFTADNEKEFFTAEAGFEISSIPVFERACFMAPSNLNFRVEVNGKVLISKDQFTIWPNSFGEDLLRFTPFYNVQPNVLDAGELASALKTGLNNIRVFLYANDTALIHQQHFGLAIHTAENNSLWTSFNIAKGEVLDAGESPVLRISVPKFTIAPDRKSEATVVVQSGGKQEKLNVRIETRGKTSLSAEKKSYSFSIVGNAQPMCGMPEGKDWILYGGWYDLSLIRNMLAFELGRIQNHYAPQSRLVELVVNNNYRGIYVLMEKPQLTSTRLHNETGDASAHDFLIMTDRVDSGDLLLPATFWTYILKSKSALSDSLYRESVLEKIQCFESNIYYGERPPCFDVKSFADYLLVQELSANRDAYRLSTFFHAFENGIDTLLKAGPLWDFDLAFHPVDDTTTWILNQRKGMPAYWHQLFGYEPFRKELGSRYAELRKTVWTDGSLISMIDSLAGLAKTCRARNDKVFPFPQLHFWPYTVLPANPDEEILLLKRNLIARTQWMDEQLNVIE